MLYFSPRIQSMIGKSLMNKNFSTFRPLCVIDKQLLTALRKKTGFSFTKCNEAMKLNDNDLEKAEIWLNVQAEKEGWAKAKKLQSRSTSQGLIGVKADKNFISLAEVACETDFVARNELFVNFVAATAQSILNFRQQVIEQNKKISSNVKQNVTHLRETVMEHELRNFKHPNYDMTVEEHIVQLVGKVGENLKLKRGLAIATAEENIIGVSTHGNSATTANGCSVGTFAGVVVLKPITEIHDLSKLRKLARDLSQHVIGMNPVAIRASDNVSNDESLLGQEFLLNDKVTVEQLITEAGVDVVDFIRYGLSQ